MRKLAAFLIFLCLAYFAGGWVASHYELITHDQYLTYAGIVGGLASVLGLLSFVRSPITNEDLQSLEIGQLQSLTENTKRIQDLESHKEQTQQEIGHLALQRRQMEALVKKASVALFLKEQHAQYESQVIRHIDGSSSLSDDLDKLRELSKKLTALEEEIEQDPNVDLLNQVIQSASKRELALDAAIDEMPPIARLMFLFVRELSQTLNKMLRIN